MPSRPKEQKQKVSAPSAKPLKRARTYTVLLAHAPGSEVKRLTFRAIDPAGVCQQIVTDWIKGKIVWESYNCNAAFSRDWLKEFGYRENRITTEEKGLAIYSWSACADCETLAYDEEVTAYILW